MRRPTPLLYLSLVEREWPRLSPLACPPFDDLGRIMALPESRRLERIGFRWNVFAQSRRATVGRQPALQSARGDLSKLFVIAWLISARSNGLG